MFKILLVWKQSQVTLCCDVLCFQYNCDDLGSIQSYICDGTNGHTTSTFSGEIHSLLKTNSNYVYRKEIAVRTYCIVGTADSSVNKYGGLQPTLGSSGGMLPHQMFECMRSNLRPLSIEYGLHHGLQWKNLRMIHEYVPSTRK